MAIYTPIYESFWTDAKVVENFTPEDKLFMFYCLTNPHKNIIGCYEISKKQMAYEIGYNEDTISKLLERMENTHKVIKYNNSTRELYIINFYKYNWTKSEKLDKPILKEIEKIKCAEFKNTLIELYNNRESVEEPYKQTMQTAEVVVDIETIDYNLYIEFYNSTCTELPKLIKLTETRKKKLKARLNDYGEQELKDMFLKASKSDLLNGKNSSNWKASFDWLLEPRNTIKVIEGNYDNKKQKQGEV